MPGPEGLVRARAASGASLRGLRAAPGRPGVAPALLILWTLAPGGARAQAPSTNDIASCSLIADPTAQRICYETARQARPAATFDPTAQKLRNERRPPPRRDALSDSQARKAGGGAATRPPGAAGQEGAGARTDWRLQIP